VWEGLVAILVPSMGLEKAHSLQQLEQPTTRSEKIRKTVKMIEDAVNTGLRARQTGKIMSTSVPIHCRASKNLR